MKKTTLFLACALPLMLAACYSTKAPIDEREAVRREYQASNGCRSQAVYQHQYFKDCVTATAKEQEKNHNTIHLIEGADGRAIVIPRAPGDEEMKNPSMVYPVVDVTVKEVVVENGWATEEDMTVEVEETQTVETQQVTEEKNVEVTTTETVTTATQTTTEEKTVETSEKQPAQQTETTTVTETQTVTVETPSETTTVTQVSVETQTIDVPPAQDGPSLEDQVNALLSGSNAEDKKEVLPTEEK